MRKEKRRIVVDFEVLSNANFWMCCMKDYKTKKEHTIINDREELIRVYNKNKDSIWVGYNIKGYDQYIFKSILAGMNPCEVSDKIIKQKIKGWDISPILNRIDLCIFDLMVERRSLKEIELYMGEDIRESSVDFNLDRYPNEQEINELSTYCMHDVRMTFKIFEEKYHEYEAHLNLIEYFKLPYKLIGKTKAQLSAIILGAKKPKYNRNDDFDFKIVNTLKFSKYKYILDWYLDKKNRHNKSSLNTTVYGIDMSFGWGGLHSARKKYQAKDFIVYSDVTSFYPAIMIEYNLLSRNVSNPVKFKDIRDKRIALKKAKDMMHSVLKIVLNSTFGASLDNYNDLYDPRQGKGLCVNGQFLLLDLIEKVELEFGERAVLIQANTDGIMFKFNSKNDIDKYMQICDEWCKRTRMELDHEFVKKINQKDVNNYIFVYENGEIKCAGDYVKNLTIFNNDLPIINKALVENIINGVSIEDTINNATELMDFQKCVKISKGCNHLLYGDKKLNLKILRVFASKSASDSSVKKVKEVGDKPHKIPYVPERVFIDNGNIVNKEIPDKLDRDWYINLAKERLDKFMPSDNLNLFECFAENI